MMGLQSKALFLTLMSGTSTVATSTAASMLGAEDQGFALDFTDRFWLAATGLYGSAKIIDTGTPANNFDRVPGDLLTYTGTTKLTLQSDGVYRYGPHNLCLQSQDISTTWSKTVAADTVQPNKLIASSTSGFHQVSQTITTVSGASYTVTIRVKASGYNYAYLNFNAGTDMVVLVRISDGTYSGYFTSGSDPAGSYTISADVDGYYFISLTRTATSTTSSIAVGTRATSGNFSSGFAGDGVSGILVSRVHVRRTPSDSTYLPTTSSTRYGLPYEWNTSGVLQGMLVEPQSTNLFLNNTTGATQTITVSNATAYTVSFFGTGSIAFSGANSSTLSGTGATDRVRTTFTTSSTSLTCTVSGSISNVQVETGSVATSVIRTYAASATRAADSKTKATSALPWSATLGTVFVSANTASGSGTQVIWQADDGSENNRFRIVRDSSNNLRFIVTTASSEVCNINLGTVANSTSFKVVVAWAANDFAATLNGGAVGTDASGALPTVTTVREGSSFTGEQWNSIIAKNEYLPRRMSNADMQALAT